MRPNDRGTPQADASLYRRCVQSTRGFVLAEAMLAVILGFTADDLGLLTFPGYIAGLAAAVLLLAAGGLFHGHRLARRVNRLNGEDTDARLHSTRMRGRIAAILTGLVFVVWLILYAQGVPPWQL